MTLILTVNGPNSLWLLADRRLSAGGRPVKDDACKVMFLDTTDGVAILGYAGLGATPRKTQPSDWMAAVLRTRNYPLEPSLGALAGAMRQQFRRPMRLGLQAHNTIIPAFVDGEARLYSIDMQAAPYVFRWTRHTVGATTKPPRLGLAGTGGIYLLRRKDKTWMRSLLRTLKAYDNGKLSSDLVADHLARLNYEVHQRIGDESVGPRCIVAWRHAVSGGGHAFYSRVTRDDNSPSIPTIVRGTDIGALISLPHLAGLWDRFKVRRAGQVVPEPNADQINWELSSLPNEPDEELR